jgi:hypothetical protein
MTCMAVWALLCEQKKLKKLTVPTPLRKPLLTPVHRQTDRPDMATTVVCRPAVTNCRLA